MLIVEYFDRINFLAVLFDNDNYKELFSESLIKTRVKTETISFTREMSIEIEKE